MPLSVVHVSQPVDGGAARCVLDLARDQVARGWEVAVACPPEGALASAAVALGAAHLSWPAAQAPGLWALGETSRLARLLRARRPELVHLHSSKAGLAGRLAGRGRIATVFQPHAWSFLAVEGLVRRGAVVWERAAARWADVVVCVSEAERRLGEEHEIRAAWRVVPNGVDLDSFAPASRQERASAREQLGFGADEPVVVCVGRLSRAKGQDLLLGAWPPVLRRVPGARLVLVGAGPDEPALARLVGPGVRLAGAQDDVRAWLAAADVVAVPSRWEAMSLAMLEAMARARSVVATDVAGAREALGDEAGAIVPIDDRGAFADALVERLLDPAKAAAEGEAGRRRAERSHDLSRVAGELAAIYEHVLQRRERGGRPRRRP